MADKNISPYNATSLQPSPDLAAASIDWNKGSKTTGTLRYLAPVALWESEKPFCLTLPLPPGQPKSNLIGASHEIQLCDTRGREIDFSLDTHGFSFVSLPDIEVDIENKIAVETEYIAQIEAWLKQHLKADSVHVFDYTLRKRKPRGEKYAWTDQRPPALNAHIDQTPPATLARLKLHFGDKIDTLLAGRVQLVNIWRPTFGPVEDFPMAVCDGRTVHESDLVAMDLVYPHYVGENYQMKFNEGHCWYYLSKMEANEGILIKNFDSMMDGRTRLCPHAAFCDHACPADARLRQSIEVRALVFHKEE